MYFETANLSRDCIDRMRENHEALQASMKRIGQRVNEVDHAILVQTIHDLGLFLKQMKGTKDV